MAPSVFMIKAHWVTLAKMLLATNLDAWTVPVVRRTVAVAARSTTRVLSVVLATSSLRFQHFLKVALVHPIHLRLHRPFIKVALVHHQRLHLHRPFLKVALHPIRKHLRRFKWADRFLDKSGRLLLADVYSTSVPSWSSSASVAPMDNESSASTMSRPPPSPWSKVGTTCSRRTCFRGLLCRIHYRSHVEQCPSQSGSRFANCGIR